MPSAEPSAESLTLTLLSPKRCSHVRNDRKGFNESQIVGAGHKSPCKPHGARPRRRANGTERAYEEFVAYLHERRKADRKYALRNGNEELADTGKSTSDNRPLT